MGSRHDRVMAVLEEAESPLSVRQIATECGLQKEGVRKVLRTAESYDMVRCAGFGRYNNRDIPLWEVRRGSRGPHLR